MTTPDAGTGNEQDRPSRGRDDLRERLEALLFGNLSEDEFMADVEAAVTEAEERARREARLEDAEAALSRASYEAPWWSDWLRARAAGGPK